MNRIVVLGGSQSMATLEELIEDYIVKYCRGEFSSDQQVEAFNAILLEVRTDLRFLQYRDRRYPDEYENASELMWEHFKRNLCEATTAEKPYLETRTYAVPRLLASLKGNLENIKTKRYKEEARREQPRMGSEGILVDPVDNLPSPEPETQPAYDVEKVWQTFLALLEADATGELNDPTHTLQGKAKTTHTLQGKAKTTQKPYKLTAQTFLLMRYRDRMGLQQIADTLDIPRGSVQGGAKPTKWKELARRFAQKAIDSQSEE
jgi:hypothetical protein